MPPQFLREWVPVQVKPVPHDRRLSEAERLAKLCIEAACVCGVSQDQLENEVGGDLISFFDKQIQEATLEHWESAQPQ